MYLFLKKVSTGRRFIFSGKAFHNRTRVITEVAVIAKIRDLFRICFRKQRYYKILNYKNTLCALKLNS